MKFRQNGVIKLYARHDVFGPDRGRLVFLLFMQQLVSSDPYKMSLCTKVVCRGNVQPGTSLKKKKRKRRKKRKRKSALRKMFPPDESRATSTKIPLCFYSTELNTPGRSINLDLCLNPTIWLPSPTTATSSSLLSFFLNFSVTP